MGDGPGAEMVSFWKTNPGAEVPPFAEDDSVRHALRTGTPLRLIRSLKLCCPRPASWSTNLQRYNTFRQPGLRPACLEHVSCSGRCVIFLEDVSGVARAADRYAPAAHTLTEALLPTTCVVVNKPPGLKHFPTIGAAPRPSESRSRLPRNRRSDVPLRGAWCLAGIRPGYIPALTLNCSIATPL